MNQTWNKLTQFKDSIITLGTTSTHIVVKCTAIKFIETLVLSLTCPPKGKPDQSFTSDLISVHPFLKSSDLELEGENRVKSLIDHLSNITSLSTLYLICCVNALGQIAKYRPQFISGILPPLQNIQIPSNWTSRQQLSLQHAIRTAIGLIKNEHPKIVESQMQQMQSQPPPQQPQGNKRPPLPTESLQVEKRPRLNDLPFVSYDTQPIQTPTAGQPQAQVQTHQEMFQPTPLAPHEQMTILALLKQLPPDLVANLVIENLSISNFPADPDFRSSEKKAFQQAGSSAAPSALPPSRAEKPIDPRVAPSDPRVIATNLPTNSVNPVIIQPQPKPGVGLVNEPPPVTVPGLIPVIKPTIVPKLPIFTPPTLTAKELQSLCDSSFIRVMEAEKGAILGGHGELWVGLVSRLAASLPLSSAPIKSLLQYIITDLSAHKELVHSWLCREYVSSPTKRYPQVVSSIMDLLKEQQWDPKDKSIVSILVELPQLSEPVWQIVGEFSTANGDVNSHKVTLGLSTLRDLTVWRPLDRDRALSTLLEYTSHPDDHVRSPAVRLVANQLYPLPALSNSIKETALAMLHTLNNYSNDSQIDNQSKEPTPDIPPSDNSVDGMDVDDINIKIEDTSTGGPSQLTEDQIHLRLYLFFALTTKNHELLPSLLEVFLGASPMVRKVILKHMSDPIKTIGMNSPQLIQLITNCPKGGEIFILQLTKVLTEGGAGSHPTAALVTAVKSLYRRTQDARLLIPILGGLEKDEVISLLPKMVVLAPLSVKAVIHKLSMGASPVSPTELLVALHNNLDNVPIKRAVEATQYCLDFTQVFNQDVMAKVLSQLYSGATIPPLFMRTVLQTLKLHVKLQGYIVEILGTLISKQVWNDRRLWEGFIRCCQVTKPTSVKALLKLPPPQLEDALKTAPDLRELLLKVLKQQPHQQKALSKAFLRVLGLDADPPSDPTPAKD